MRAKRALPSPSASGTRRKTTTRAAARTEGVAGRTFHVGRGKERVARRKIDVARRTEHGGGRTEHTGAGKIHVAKRKKRSGNRRFSLLWAGRASPSRRVAT